MLEINNSWKEILKSEFEKPYFKELAKIVDNSYDKEIVYPPKELIFRSLELVDYDNVKVVILGQDPYHGENQANGIAFAVNDGNVLPPSLQNIFKEIKSDIGEEVKGSGTLLGWAKQGVLLLNTSLTVKKAQPGSHSAIGWQTFTDRIVLECSKREKPMVFILWGANAGAKRSLIAPQHLVLSSCHPSPLSAYRGFFGCKHFSKANEFLVKHNEAPIDFTDTDGDLPNYYNNSKKIHIV